ncbi:MAG TPA: RnfABCDGE type electron transport complex subunit D [Spirochaetia bacterium]|nr:RnfABCDGE type electron transport complex subunit D [Spirochaetia bacterium]
MPAKPLLLSSSPHLFSAVTTRRIMLAVVLALLPATVFGVYLYGSRGLFLVAATIAAAVASEWLFRLALKREPSVGDCSALVTGLLLALTLPPSTPLWMAALGAVMAIVVAKEFFGGLGANPFNPALIGRAFLLMSFPAAMTSWHRPFAGIVDAASSATPLNLVKQGAPLAELFASVGAQDQGSFYWQLFLGNRSGSLGESSILLVLAGGLLLLALGVIQLWIPLTVLGSTALFSWLLGMDPVFALLSGGVVFGAFFMATDYATSPLTTKGKLIYGLAIGLVIALIRKLGGFPEGVTYGILVMNMISPFLDRLRMKKYGYVAPKKPAAAKEAAK